MSVKLSGRKPVKLRPRNAKKSDKSWRESAGRRKRCPTCGAERDR